MNLWRPNVIQMSLSAYSSAKLISELYLDSDVLSVIARLIVLLGVDEKTIARHILERMRPKPRGQRVFRGVRLPERVLIVFEKHGKDHVMAHVYLNGSRRVSEEGMFSSAEIQALGVTVGVFGTSLMIE